MLLDDVAALLEDVSRTAIVPWRNRLLAGDIQEKSPGELVTVADQEAERLITEGLSRLLPGVPVVGEEATAADPALLDLLPRAPRAWLVDPIDGTKAFVAGSDDFAVMVALVEHGETVASWVHQPATGTTYRAERGGGAHRDGQRLLLQDEDRPLDELRGAALTRFLTPERRAKVAEVGSRLAHLGPGRGAAGIEYPLVAEGSQDFVLFWRTLPWDHAPGALLVTEAGGTARHLDGRNYRPGRPCEGLLVAAGPRTWQQVADDL